MTNLGFELDGPAGLPAGWQVRGQASASWAAGWAGTPTIAPCGDPHAFDAASWTAVDAGLPPTPFPDNWAAPDNSGTTADDLIASAGAGLHGLQGPALTLLAGQHYRFSCCINMLAEQACALAFDAGGAQETACVFSDWAGFMEPHELVLSGAVGAGFAQVGSSVHRIAPGWILACMHLLVGPADLTGSFAVLFSSTGGLSYTAAGGETIAAWGASWHDALYEAETFALGWGCDAYAQHLTVPSSAEYALFDTDYITWAPVEDFESAWSNYPWYTVLTSAVQGTFDTVPEAREDFEEDWAGGFVEHLVGAVLATFDTGAEQHEDFEEDWLAWAYATTLSGEVASTFDNDAGTTVEDFEEVLAPLSFVVEPTTDVFTHIGHTMVDGTPVWVLPAVGGALAAPLNLTQLYWVRDKTADTWKLALTSGGAALDITSAGVGMQQLQGDPAVFWIEQDESIV